MDRFLLDWTCYVHRASFQSWRPSHFWLMPFYWYELVIAVNSSIEEPTSNNRMQFVQGCYTHIEVSNNNDDTGHKKTNGLLATGTTNQLNSNYEF